MHTSSQCDIASPHQTDKLLISDYSEVFLVKVTVMQLTFIKPKGISQCHKSLSG